MADERWLSIPEWEGLYEVSDHGAVRSLDRVLVGPSGRRRRFQGKPLQTFNTASGYPSLHLYRNGRRSNRSVHELALLAFVGSRPDGMVTRHLNGDPSDNRLTNLAYGTGRENMLDRTRHGRCHNANKECCPSGHPYEGANLMINNLGSRVCRACMSITGRKSRMKRVAS